MHLRQKLFQKTAEAISDLNGNKIEENIVSDNKLLMKLY